MEIECPGCAARYDVPDEVARPGRVMRCARCGETWTPRVAEAESLPPTLPPVADGAPDWSAFVPEAGSDADDELAVVAADERPTPVAAQTRGSAALLAASWVASAVALAAAIWAAWHFHGRIEHAWPPSARLFGLFERRR